MIQGIFGDGSIFKLPRDNRPSSPPVLDPKDPIDAAILERHKRIEFEEQQVQLAQIISETLYDDLVHETARSYGSEQTRQTYRSDFNRFQSWCNEQKPRFQSLPTSPEIVTLYLLSCASTSQPDRLARTVAAIKFTHEWANKQFRSDDLQIKAALRFCRRAWEQEQAKEQQTDAVVENTEEPKLNGSGGQH